MTAGDLMAALRQLGFEADAREQARLRAHFRGGDLDPAAFCRGLDYVPAPEPEPEREREPETEKAQETAGQPPPKNVLRALRSFRCAMERCGFADECRARDPLRHGEVAESQFVAVVIGAIGCEETDALVEYYRAPGRRVAYATLLRDVDACELDVPGIGPEARGLDEILAAFDAELRPRKLEPPDLFLKFDRARSGEVQGVRVVSVFDQIGVKLNAEEERIVRDRFAGGESGEMFDYRRLAEYMRPQEVRKEVGGVRVDGEVVELLERIRERSWSGRRRAGDAFAKGAGEEVSEEAFREAIGKFRLSLREWEIQRLLRAYRVGSQGDVDWQRFVADVESARAPN
jgi:hypothetical protein